MHDRVQVPRSPMRAAFETLALVAGATLLSMSSPSAALAKPSCSGHKATIVGSKGRDVIRAPRAGTQVVVARGGNDRIIVRGSSDIVCAGSGDDVVRGGGDKDILHGEAGNDFVDGGPGSDRITLGAGNDVMIGGPGGETAAGGAGDDRLYGEFQDDRLQGEAGNDFLAGGQGTDTLLGGIGDDWMRGDIGFDDYDGGEGTDTTNLASFTLPGYKTPPERGAQVELQGFRFTGEEKDELLNGTENIIGSAFDDVLAGKPFTASGLVRGLSGSDFCMFFASTECDPEPWEPGAGAFVATGAPDPGVVVIGSAAADRVSAASTGGGVRITSSTPLAAGSGCSGSGAVTCTTAGVPDYVVLAGQGGDDTLAVEGGFSRPTYLLLDGGEGSDTLRGSRANELLLAGRNGNDLLDAGAGDDLLLSRLGADAMRGGAGEDQLTTSDPCAGHVFSGGPGGPDIAGMAQTRPATGTTPGWLAPTAGKGGVKARLGGEASMTLPYAPISAKHPTARCAPSRIMLDNEILEGTTGDDKLLGSKGPDPLIIGREGDDVIRGLGGTDRIRGEPGADSMFGGLGFDFLEATDKGRDRRIDCGSGGGSAKVDANDPFPRRCNGRR